MYRAVRVLPLGKENLGIKFTREFCSVTKNYFENLVRALETGLKDVGTSNNQATCSKGSSSKSLGNKSKSGKIKAVAGSSSGSGAPSRSFDDGNLWSCDRCTYANPSIESMQALKTYSPSEISLHTTKKDCWLSIHGKVQNFFCFLLYLIVVAACSLIRKTA
ncbi:hypothetical protein BHE74_00008225 [Ensete ventricosum]|nr:hypothetical protein BHE74_00008225 [Ensete ventricosum]